MTSICPSRSKAESGAQEATALIDPREAAGDQPFPWAKVLAYKTCDGAMYFRILS